MEVEMGVPLDNVSTNNFMIMAINVLLQTNFIVVFHESFHFSIVCHECYVCMLKIRD